MQKYILIHYKYKCAFTLHILIDDDKLISKTSHTHTHIGANKT
jgi:hypothetical protein